MTPRVVTLGEAMLRLWVPEGERIETAHRFNVTVAGAEANVAVALARMGVPVAWLSRLPMNPLGRRTQRALAAQGVDVSGLAWSAGGRMGTFYVELAAAPRPVTVVYDRAGSAAAQMTADDIAWDLVDGAELAFVSGITPALSASCRDATVAYMTRARGSGATVVFDVNYRSRLWSPEEAAPVLRDMCRLADLVVVSEEDAREVFSLGGTVEDLMEAMAGPSGSIPVVMTRGASGAAWRTATAGGIVAPIEAKVVDPIGAGDAFAAGVIIGLLDDDLAGGVELGAALGAVEVGLHGDMLTVEPEEIDAVRRGAGRDVAR